MTRTVVVITGATRGLGRAVLQRFVRHGIAVVGLGSNLGSANQLVTELKEEEEYHKQSNVPPIAVGYLDFAAWPEWVALKNWSISDLKSPQIYYNSIPFFQLPFYGKNYRVSCLINCAGITQHSLAVSTNDEKIKRIMNINFNSPVSLSRLFLRHQMKYGNNTNKSCIINVSSILGSNNIDDSIIIPGTSIYSASKSALSKYTNVLKYELRDKSNFGIYNIEPYLLNDTDMGKTFSSSNSSSKIKIVSKDIFADKIFNIYLKFFSI